MGSFSIWHWLIVLVVVVLIFGTKKLGNIGKTVDLVEIEAPTASTISALATAIKGGSIKTLLVLNRNG